MPDTDVHIAVWRAGARVEKYRALEGWIDAGERVVLNAVADGARDRGVLDLGVGAGRTTWMLRLLTRDYVGLDWSPEMVAASRSALPGVDIRLGDARDLSQFPDARFSLVVFSYNGIDNVGHGDREVVVDNVQRVLEPGGAFVYSTSSKLGPFYRHPPSLRIEREEDEHPGRFAARALYSALAQAPRHRARVGAWRAAMASAEDHPEWGLAPVEALDFRLAHFTTVGAETRALAAAGMVVAAVVSDTGEPIERDGPGYSWFHVVARKPR